MSNSLHFRANFWFAAPSLALVLWAVSFALPTRRSASFRLLLALVFAFSLMVFSVSLEPLALRLAFGSGGASQSSDTTITLAIFTIIATLAAGWAFLVVNRFEKERSELGRRVAEAEKSASDIDRISGGMAAELRVAQSALVLEHQRIQAFLFVYRQIRTASASGADHARLISLQLIESLICRTDLAGIEFDLEELVCVASTLGRELDLICVGPIYEYFCALPDAVTSVRYDPLSEASAESVQRLVALLLSLLRGVSA